MVQSLTCMIIYFGKQTAKGKAMGNKRMCADQRIRGFDVNVLYKFTFDICADLRMWQWVKGG